MISNFEYMTDPKRIEKTINKMSNLTIQELCSELNPDKNYLEVIMRMFESVKELDREQTYKMDYFDFLCLIDDIGGEKKYNSESLPSYAVQQTVNKMVVRSLLDLYNKNNTVRMFLSIPIGPFYEYLEKQHFDKKILIECEYATAPRSDVYKMTIRDYLDSNSRKISKFKGNNPEFHSSVERKNYSEALFYEERVLFGAFKMAYQERFCIADVIEKYSDK